MRKHNEILVLLRVVLVFGLLALAGCDEPMLPPVAKVTQKPGQIDTKGMPAFVETGVKRADPNRPRRAPDAVAKSVEKIKSGENFIDVEVMPAVRLASQRVADEAVVTKTSVSLPTTGNEAFLAMKPGEIMVAGAAQSGQRRGGKGDNVFGMMRKVVSVKQVGDQIIVETANAKLSEVLSGAASLSGALTEAADVDVTGIDLDQYFKGRTQLLGEPLKEGGFEVKKGAWGLDEEIDLAGFQIGGEHTFKFKNAVNMDGVEVNNDAELYVKAKAGLALGMGFGFDIDGLFKDINYVRLYAYGKAYAEAGAGLTSKSKATGLEGMKEEFEDALEKIHMGNPVKAANMDTFKIAEKIKAGPTLWAGPVPIPTTYLIEVLVTCNVKVSSSMTIVADAGVDAEVKVGLEFSTVKLKKEPKSLGLSPIIETTFNKWSKFEMTDGSASLTVECLVGPKIHWLIAGVAGPFVDIRGGLRGTMEYDAVCKAPDQIDAGTSPSASLGVLVEAGVKAAVGGGIDINDLFEIEFSFDLFEYWFELWKKTWWLDNPPVICPSMCNDGIKNNGEQQIDCGNSVCQGCPAGTPCVYGGCAKGLTCYTGGVEGAKEGVCSSKNDADPCNDGKINPPEQGIGEIDVDCGGKCGKCKSGQNCGNNGDCASDLCQENTKK